MYVCIYLRMHVCIYVCMYISTSAFFLSCMYVSEGAKTYQTHKPSQQTHTHTYAIHTRTDTQTRRHTHTHLFTGTSTGIGTCTGTQTHTHKHTHTHTHTDTHAHTHTHTHTHTYTTPEGSRQHQYAARVIAIERNHWPLEWRYLNPAQPFWIEDFSTHQMTAITSGRKKRPSRTRTWPSFLMHSSKHSRSQ